MPLYESTFIVRHDMSAQQVENLAETFTKILTDNDGKVTKTEHWGIKSLAYRINKNRKGHYVHFNVDAPSAALQELERNMRLSEDVLRYLTIKVDELEEGPSIVMQARSSRDDRGRRGGRFGGGPGGRFGGGPARRDGPPRQDAKAEGDGSGAKGDPDKAAKPDEAAKPVEAEKSAKAAEPDKAAKPDEAAKPVEAEKSAKAAEPDKAPAPVTEQKKAAPGDSE